MNEDELTKVRAALTQAIDADCLMRLARASGFLQRLRVITPQQLVVSVIAAMASRTTETIADVQRTFNAMTGLNAAYKPFHKMLAKPQFGVFMRDVVVHLFQHLLLTALRPMSNSALNIFKDILLHDGTSFAVHDALANVFPGRYPAKSRAAVEIHATLSLWNEQPLRLFIAPDTDAERYYIPAPCELKDLLIIADRGYQSIDYCREVDAAGGHVLIRHQTRVDPVIVQGFREGKPIQTYSGRRLSDVMARCRGDTLDLDGQWQGIGSANRPDTRLRLVLWWNAATEDHMALVTNLDRDLFSPADLYQLYRLRWQVELLFKEWKSYCNLHRFNTSKESIATGFMWAALAACIIKRFIAKAAQRVFRGGEISTRKTAMAVGHHLYTLLGAVIANQRLHEPLLAMLRYLSSQARRAHPERDRTKGRLRLGIVPVT